MTSSAIDKMFEIFGPIFEQNVTINFEPIFEQNANFGPIFEKSAYFDPIFERSVNFEHFVNGRWSQYKAQNLGKLRTIQGSEQQNLVN